MTNDQAKALKVGDKCRVVSQPEPPAGLKSSDFLGRIGAVLRPSKYGNVELDFGNGPHIWDAEHLDAVG